MAERSPLADECWGWRPCARRTLPLADVAEGYRATDERRAIKTLVMGLARKPAYPSGDAPC